MSQDLSDLLEIRREITRVNTAAGRTIFNPAATQALDGLIARASAAKEAGQPNDGGKK